MQSGPASTFAAVCGWTTGYATAYRAYLVDPPLCMKSHTFQLSLLSRRGLPNDRVNFQTMTSGVPSARWTLLSHVHRSTKSKMCQASWSKACIGNDHPCDNTTLTYLSVNTITIGDGGIATFWHAPWLHGLKPKGIASVCFFYSFWECIFWAPSHLAPHIWSVNSSIKIRTGLFFALANNFSFLYLSLYTTLNLKLGSSLQHLR
jgi:hypothetical protein